MTNNERFKIFTAVFLLLRRGNEIFMMRRFNTGFRDGYYDLVSGHLDGDETYREAAVREAKEEAGVDVGIGDMQFIHAIHSRNPTPDKREYMSLYFQRMSGPVNRRLWKRINVMTAVGLI